MESLELDLGIYSDKAKSKKELIVLPYMGSKSRILPIIKDSIPKEIDCYVEPFAGGFSLGLNLMRLNIVDSKACDIIVNDLDIQVYDFWSCVRDNAWNLINEIDNLCNFIEDAVLYKNIENKYLYSYAINDFCKDKYTRSALFYMCKKLNKGGTKKSLIKSLNYMTSFSYNDSILSGSALVENIKTYNMSFEDLMSNKSIIGEKSFWYLDPPYYDYSNGDFYEVCKGESFNHELLHSCLNSESFKGKFILSYDDCEYIRNLYKDCNIYPIKLRSKVSTLGYSKELLISNYSLNI